MNTFKRKALSCAVLAGLGAVAGAAHAVYQDPTGLGQVLIYPYYTVQQAGGNSYNTYISVVNSTATGKAVKVRFREGKNSREVLDFNLWLSPNDMWTGAVVPADATTSSNARLVTSDTSCISPQQIPTGGADFQNYAYVGATADGAGTGLDRTREGYLEMLEMATVNDVAPLNALTAITHVAGVPANCGAVHSNTLATTAPAGTFTAPTGGLSGTYTLINVQNGADMGGNALAFANFTTTPNYTEVSDEAFNFGSGDPVSVVVSSQPTGATAYQATWTAPVDAMSATMMHSSVINEYVLDTASVSQTDWVMTFPTKRFYVTTAAAATPFTNKFTSTGSCEPISFTFFNREEDGATVAPGGFSPSPPGVSGDNLCWESTVVSVRNGAAHMPTGTTSAVLGSVNSQGVHVGDSFQNGWAQMDFTGTNATTLGIVSVAAGSNAININTGTSALAAAQTYLGLPVVGFMARTFDNGTLTCTGAGGVSTSCQGNYGSLFNHKFLQSITPTP